MPTKTFDLLYMYRYYKHSRQPLIQLYIVATCFTLFLFLLLQGVVNLYQRERERERERIQ